MSQFVQFVVSGAVAGALYALMASGLALTYSTSGVFNFAHGSIAFVTALLYYELNSGLGWPIVPAVVAAILAAVGLGLLVRRTSLGLRLRASVDRRDLASLRGVDPDRSSTIAWMLGTLLAGAAGVLGAPILALGAYPFTLVMLVSAT